MTPNSPRLKLSPLQDMYHKKQRFVFLLSLQLQIGVLQMFAKHANIAFQEMACIQKKDNVCRNYYFVLMVFFDLRDTFMFEIILRGNCLRYFIATLLLVLLLVSLISYYKH